MFIEFDNLKAEFFIVSIVNTILALLRTALFTKFRSDPEKFPIFEYEVYRGTVRDFIFAMMWVLLIMDILFMICGCIAIVKRTPLWKGFAGFLAILLLLLYFITTATISFNDLIYGWLLYSFCGFFFLEFTAFVLYFFNILERIKKF